jgi:hypothetical protein
MARRPLPLAVLICTLLGMIAGSAAPAAAARVAVSGEPPERRTLELREAWRAGGEDESDVLLGQVGVVASGPGGEVYALDSQLSHVQVFSADGEHLGILGRQGDGPGEFRQPVNLYLPGDGTVAVQQAFPGRVVFVQADDGTPAGEWTYGGTGGSQGGFVFIETARERGGTFAVSGAASNFDMENRQIRSTNFLSVVDQTGAELMRLAERQTERSMVEMTIDELAEYYPGDRGLWDVGPDGRLYLAPSYDAYEIAVHDPSGEPRLTIAREDYEARVRTEEDKEAKRNSMNININGMEPEIHWKLQDREPCIDRLQVLDDGTLWVQHSKSRVDWGEHGRVVFDVFGPDGRYLREVTVDVPEGGEGHRLVLLDDGRFVLVKGMDSISISVQAGDGDGVTASDEPLGDTLLELVCYEVVR